MDCTFIEQWKVIIDQDLKDARRCLAAASGVPMRLLGDRIAEDEAILERLLHARCHPRDGDRGRNFQGERA
jgi:hypothetical protein